MSIESYIPKIEQTLQTLLLPFKENTDPLLYEAASYSLFSGGKRIRPLLLLLALESLDVDITLGLYPACAIEILHTYSLIHDDLPCMDDDDLRRGKPTLHKVYGEGQAVLVGDLLLTFAFQVLSYSPHIPPSSILQLIQIASTRCGGQGMILGQSLDLLAEEKNLSIEELYLIHEKKTSDLLSACLECAAIIAKKEELQDPMSRIGTWIGLSFQLIDDVLDVEGNPSAIGKNLGSDIKNHKTTGASLLGTTLAKKEAQALLDKALLLCGEIGLGGSLLAKFLPKLVHRQL